MSAAIHGEVLQLLILNPGRIAPTGDSTGLGLRNARTRLTHLFGPAARLTLTQRTPDLVGAEVLIPRPTLPALS